MTSEIGAAGGAFILHGVPVHVRPDLPAAEAIGVMDGIVAAAGDLAAVRASLPPTAPVRRLGAGAILPAFIDPHQHAFLIAADPGTDVLYRRAVDVAGLVDAVAALVAAEEAPGTGGAGTAPAAAGVSSAPPAPWLRYHGYEPMKLAEHRSPTAAELDRASADRPLHVLSRTFHESVVNSAGLDALGIGRTTPDPPGGRIVRDKSGEPTGVLIEAASFAAEAASRRADAHDPRVWRDRLRAYGRRLLAAGIVRIGDAAVPVAAADALVETLGALGITAHPFLIGDRIDLPALLPGGTAKVLLDGGEYCHLRMTTRQVATVVRRGFQANMGREKGLARAVGERAGWPHREADGRWHTGVRFPAEGDLRDLLRRAAERGSGLVVHAVGNGSVEALLDARDADPGVAAAVPMRVEHAIALDPRLSGRLAQASLTVVAQPNFLGESGHELNVTRMPEPLRLMPFRSMLAAGVPLAFSSDHPATGLSPWPSLAAAVTRLDQVGAPVVPEEAIDLPAALDAYGRGAARSLGVTGGTLEPGMPADMILVDADPYGITAVAAPGDLRAHHVAWRARRLGASAGDRRSFLTPDVTRPGPCVRACHRGGGRRGGDVMMERATFRTHDGGTIGARCRPTKEEETR